MDILIHHFYVLKTLAGVPAHSGNHACFHLYLVSFPTFFSFLGRHYKVKGN